MILVIAEQRDGKLNRATWEAIAAAQRWLRRQPIKVAVLGRALGDVADELAAAGVAEVLTVEHPALAHVHAGRLRAGARAGRRSRSRRLRAAAAHVSDARLCADAGGAARSQAADHRRDRRSRALAATRRSRGRCSRASWPPKCGRRATAPCFVTVQIGAFRADAATKGGAAPVTAVESTIDASAIRQKPEAPFQEAKQAVDLSQAERIVAVGRGIKSQENMPMAEKLAKAMGAELAASRPICDNGWLPMERQIGSSGQTVAPKLYVALGISGAIQHLVGMKGARTIVAINKDADAPIFEVADYGIVGDCSRSCPR